MKTYRVTRLVTTVQYTMITTDGGEAEAVEVAECNPHLCIWKISSHNDPVITDVEEIE